MNIAEFSALALTGSQSYFNYLKTKDRGYEEIPITKIAQEDALYLLRLSKNPFSTDVVRIRIGRQIFDQRTLEIVEHDRDNRVLYVRISEEIADPFMNVKEKDVMIISDLKFLIERVRDWYKNNGRYLQFPCPAPRHSLKQIIQQDVSENQNESIHDVFSYPSTYVWGAPGTGKTRYVLAECLLQYYRAGKKVAVLAPTNNAIEQVLYGVLDKLQKHDIPLEHVLRLGTPTTKFAEQYGAICEVQGIEKRLREMQSQILFLENILKHRSFLSRMAFAENTILPLFEELFTLLDRVEQANSELQMERAQLMGVERKQRSIYAERISAEAAVKNQQRHMQSFGYKISSRLSAATDREGKGKLEVLQQIAAEKKQEYENARREQEQAKQQVNQKQQVVAEQDHMVDSAIRELKRHLSSIERFRQIGNQMNRVNARSCHSTICDFISAGQKARAEGAERFAEYAEQSDKEIQSRISEIKADKQILGAQSTDKRLESARIVAATVDTFLFRQQPRDFEEVCPYAHIFLDEAGYCSLIKAIPLFGYSCPVTMLGDHMQLPPVCEVDENDLSKEINRGIFLFAQSALFVEESMLCEDEAELLNQYLRHDQPRFCTLHRSNLCKTYRFGNLLASILDKHVYRNGFCSANNAQDFVIEVLDAQRIPGGEKRQNLSEAEVIKERLRTCSTDDYAMLAPYRNQVVLLRNIFPKEGREQRIMTIHAAQGREWDTVFISIVDTSDMYFTNSKRPELGGLQIINTAVSRAKKRLIIVCDKAFWDKKEGQLITELIHAEQ